MSFCLSWFKKKGPDLSGSLLVYVWWNMKYTAKSVSEITTNELKAFVKRYNSTITRLNRKMPHLGIASVLPKITVKDIILNQFEFKGETNAKVSKLATNRQIAEKLNKYSQLFDKENQSVTVYGGVATIKYIKKVTKQNERKIKRKSIKSDIPLTTLDPSSLDSLKKGFAIRENRVKAGREYALNELYKLNYMSSVKTNMPRWLQEFEKMLQGISGQKMQELGEDDERLTPDFNYSDFEADAKADYILTLWAGKLGKSYNPPTWFEG